MYLLKELGGGVCTFGWLSRKHPVAERPQCNGEAAGKKTAEAVTANLATPQY